VDDAVAADGGTAAAASVGADGVIEAAGAAGWVVAAGELHALARTVRTVKITHRRYFIKYSSSEIRK
jgi:hypothetical protein